MTEDEQLQARADAMVKPLDETRPLDKMAMRKLLMCCGRIDKPDGAFRMVVTERNLESCNIDTLCWDKAGKKLVKKGPAKDDNQITQQCYVVEHPLAVKVLERMEQVAGCSWQDMRDLRERRIKGIAGGLGTAKSL